MGVSWSRAGLRTLAGVLTVAALIRPAAAGERGPAPPLPLEAAASVDLAPAESSVLGPALVPQLVGTIEPLPGSPEPVADELSLREPRFARAPSRPTVKSWDGAAPPSPAATGWEALWGWWPAASAAMTAQAGDLWAAAWKSLAEGEGGTEQASAQWQLASATSARVDAEVYHFIQAHDGTSDWTPALDPRNDREALAVLGSWCRETLLEDLTWARHRAPANWRTEEVAPRSEPSLAPADRWLAAFTGQWALVPTEGPLGFDTIIDSPERILFLRSSVAADDWAAGDDWITPGVAGPASRIEMAPWADLEVQPPLAGQRAEGRSLDQATAERLWSQQIELLRPLCLVYARWLSRATQWLERTPAALAQAGRYEDPTSISPARAASGAEQVAAEPSGEGPSEHESIPAVESERAAVGPGIEADGGATWHGPAVLDFGL